MTTKEIDYFSSSGTTSLSKSNENVDNFQKLDDCEIFNKDFIEFPKTIDNFERLLKGAKEKTPLLRNISNISDLILSEQNAVIPIRAGILFQKETSSRMLNVPFCRQCVPYFIDCYLIFYMNDGETAVYYLNEKIDLVVSDEDIDHDVFSFVLLTSTELDTSVLYAQFLASIQSFKITPVAGYFMSLLLLCNIKNSAVENDNVHPIVHFSEQLTCLINQNRKKEDTLKPCKTPAELHEQITKLYKI